MLNIFHRNIVTALLLLPISAILVACGGGGGGSTITNNPPITASGVINVVVDTAKTSTFLGSDPDGDALTFAIVNNGALGTATITNSTTGEFTYTPNPSMTGDDVLTFKVNDGIADSNLSTIDVQIMPSQPPVSVDDTFNTNEGSTLVVDNNVLASILSNDADPENDTLSAAIVTNVSAGMLVLNSDGTFTYTHDGSETITDSFTYISNDGTSSSNTATVTLNIIPVNDAPVAVSDAYSSIPEGGSVVIDTASGILTNDSDAENDVLTVSLVSAPQFASLFTLNADGSFNYAHNGSENFSDSFTYRVNDGLANSNVTTVTLTITPINETPVANDDSYTGVNEGATLNVNAALGVINNDTDPENNTLTASLVSNVTFGSLVFNADGSFSYTHNGSENFSDSFTYRVSDGFASSNIATVTLIITPVNEAPVANDDSYAGMDEGATLNVNAALGVNNNDVDGDNNTLTASLVSDVTFGSLVLNADGSFSYTHNGSENFSDSFTYRVSDGFVNSNTATVTLSITPLNDAPVANDDSYTGVDEGATLNVNAAQGVNNNDTDAENNTFTAALVSDVAFGSLTFNADGSFSYVHDGSENFSDSFTYRVNDGFIDSNIATVSLTITPVNEAPVANDDSYAGVDEGATLNVNAALGVNNNDTDAENNSLTASLVADVSFGLLTLNADGSFTYEHNGSENFSDNFTYRVNDGFIDSNIATVSLTITPVNDVPVANDDAYTVNLGSVLNITDAVNDGILANDTDADNVSLTAVLVSGPSFASSFTINPDGTFSYTHDGSANFTDTFTYTAYDGTSSSNAATVAININQLPAATASCSTTPQESSYNGTLVGSDADTPTLLTFSLNADGSGGNGPIATARGSVTITNSTSGAYTYTPNSSGSRGIDIFDFRVEDPDGGFASATETVIVNQKIMPLGDSITRGTTLVGFPLVPERVGYRKPLYDSLLAANYTFDFVGGDSLTGGGISPFDPDNEGHEGFSAVEIAFGESMAGYPTDGIRSWLEANPTDIILLHIGTNDGPIAGTEIIVESILDEIDAWESNMGGNPITVILAKIINQNPTNPNVPAYNTALEAMALDRVNNITNPAYPDDIIIVDQHSALTYPVDMITTLHPTTVGYGKMAPVWHNSLVTILDKCP